MTATANSYLRDSVCRIRIEINGTTIVDSLTCGLVGIGRRGIGLPALICACDYDIIRCLLEDRIIQTIALREITETHNYLFDFYDVKQWQLISQERPDLVSAARKLESDVNFLEKFQSEIKNWSQKCIELVTPEMIYKSLDQGFNVLLIQITDQVMEATRTGVGLEERSAKAKQRAAVKLTRQFVSDIGAITLGRKKGSKSKSPRFTYDKFQRAVRELGRDEVPSQNAVAKFMGYQGQYADDQLRRDLRQRIVELTKRGHTDCGWKILVDEVLSGVI